MLCTSCVSGASSPIVSSILNLSNRILSSFITQCLIPHSSIILQCHPSLFPHPFLFIPTPSSSPSIPNLHPCPSHSHLLSPHSLFPSHPISRPHPHHPLVTPFTFLPDKPCHTSPPVSPSGVRRVHVFSGTAVTQFPVGGGEREGG